jgi:hypothetical protein
MPKPEEKKNVCPKCYQQDIERIRAKYLWRFGSGMHCRMKKVLT